MDRRGIETTVAAGLLTIGAAALIGATVETAFQPYLLGAGLLLFVVGAGILARAWIFAKATNETAAHSAPSSIVVNKNNVHGNNSGHVGDVNISGPRRPQLVVGEQTRQLSNAGVEHIQREIRLTSDIGMAGIFLSANGRGITRLWIMPVQSGVVQMNNGHEFRDDLLGWTLQCDLRAGRYIVEAQSMRAGEVELNVSLQA